MNLVQIILGVSGYRQAKMFTHSCKNPRTAQETLLKKILLTNSITQFGKKYDFKSIRSIAEFQERIPPASYADHEPFIQQEIAGSKNQLTADPIKLFATTSGTTGARKFIPITATSRRDKSVAMRLWLYHAANAYPEMFDGKILAVVSPEIEGYTESGIPFGAESGHAYRNMPGIMQNVYALPYDVFAISDYESKYYTILRLTAEMKITTIGSANPSTILLLARKLQTHQERIIRDIHDGVLDSSLILDAEIREKLQRGLSPNPERAKELEELIQEDGALLPRNVWPEIAMIGCWKGGSVGLYLRDFPKYFSSSTPIRDWGYLASEVRGSVPISETSNGGILTIETNFFEFVREEEADSQSPTYLTADQLEEGKRYFIYPTTTGGLYRYEMNDIIRVTGFYERTPLVEFIQKGKGVSSLTGEKLYESQICEAVSRAAGIIPSSYEFIVAAPVWEDPPRYAFLVEEETKCPDSTWLEWITKVDKHLQEQNEEYEIKRKSLRLGPPIARLTEKGEYLRYRKAKVEAGAPDGQFKMLKITPDIEFSKQFKVDRDIDPWSFPPKKKSV